MGFRELGRHLELSPTLISRLVRRGMPVDSEEAARAWRQHYVKARKEVAPPAVVPIDIQNRSRGLDGGKLEATLERLREEERTIAEALQALLKEGRLSEAAALRREHVGTVRALFDAESRVLKINEARGRLISVDKALGLINEAMQSAIVVLRRLPEMGRDPEERRRLEAFLNGVLSEFKRGAADSLKNAADGPS